MANGNLGWRRRFFHFILFLEGTALLILYFVNSRHDILVSAIGNSFMMITFFMGVVFLEYDTYCFEKTEKELANKEGENIKQPDYIDTANGPILCAEKNLNATSSAQETAPSLRESSNSNYKIEKNVEEPLVPLENSKRETMCSIQDLLANTSKLHSLYEDNDRARNYVAERQSNCSINKIGLPLKDGVSSFSSLQSSKSFCLETSDSTAKSDSHHTSKLNENNDMNCVNNSSNKRQYIEACETVAQYLFSIPSNECDYENIYDAVPADISSTKQDCTYVQPFPSKSFLLQSANESSATSSVTHDYENIPAINVHRANIGVRHWKTYLDIEDRIHDYSTYKERSEIQDSILASNLYTTNVIVTNINNTPYTLLEKAGSHYSISLPDLSNITPATCIEVERGLNPNINGGKDTTGNLDEEFHGNSTVEDHISNYEAIWYEDFKDDENQGVDNSPKLFLGVDGKIQESLCNLYYSRLSDLSSKYFAYGIKRNASLHSIPSGYQKEKQTRKFPLSKPQLLFELNSNYFASSLVSSISTPKGKKQESMKTQRSPLMKLVALSQNSLHEHTSKALQAGKRVFYRPRIHVITPKGKAAGNRQLITFRESSNDDQAKNFSIDPSILKKRTLFSPKDKLILSEASALIRKQESGDANFKRLSQNAEITGVFKDIPNFDENGPQHSTPEGNRHIPQMSILSTISSVASPDEIKVDIEEVLSKKSSPPDSSPLKQIFSSHLLQNGKRCSTKVVSEMSVIQEFEQCPSQV